LITQVVSKFKAAIVKIDVAYPYGEKHEQFGKLSSTLSSNPDILVAEVGVKDYGDKENVDIAERYKIVKEEYPVMLLFTEGKAEPIRYQVPNKKLLKQVHQ
jgi:endoplasmic reticulum protein 29